MIQSGGPHRRWRAASVEELVRVKAGQRILVVVPARDEARTVEGVVGPVLDDLVHRAPLVDEVLVIDGRSTDATAALAEGRGARVVSLPERVDGRILSGKGSALWYALRCTDADLLVFLDADVSPSTSGTVCALLTPLMLDPGTAFVKAAFDRPLTVGGLLQHGSGGRVTELLARPLLNAWWPELAAFVQPLAGEVALRRSLAAGLPFADGYGLELGMLVDVLEAVGSQAMAQVDIGERHHRHHSDAALGRMAAAVLATALQRRGLAAESEQFVQFERVDGRLSPASTTVVARDLPPLTETGFT